MQCHVTICCKSRTIEVKVNAMVELVSAKVTSEDGTVADVKEAPFKRVWEQNLRIGVNGANKQAVIIMSK